jgi:hypothetical protein
MASSNSTPTPVPFPQPKGINNPNSSATPPDSPGNARRQRTSTNASAISNRVRTASIKLMEANPPPGMWAATGTTTSKAPSLADIRRGSFGSDGWNEDTQRKRAGSRTSQEKTREPSRVASGSISPLEGGVEPFPAVTEEDMREHHSGEATLEAPRYDIKDKDVATDIELRQSNSLTDKNDEGAVREPLTSSGQVRTWQTIAGAIGRPINDVSSMPMDTFHLRSSLGSDPSSSVRKGSGSGFLRHRASSSPYTALMSSHGVVCCSCFFATPRRPCALLLATISTLHEGNG